MLVVWLKIKTQTILFCYKIEILIKDYKQDEKYSSTLRLYTIGIFAISHAIWFHIFMWGILYSRQWKNKKYGTYRVGYCNYLNSIKAERSDMKRKLDKIMQQNVYLDHVSQTNGKVCPTKLFDKNADLNILRWLMAPTSCKG